MLISIYQINMARDAHLVKFRSLERWPEYYEGQPDASLYDRIFTGEVEAQSLEAVFCFFNQGNYPAEYNGHSLSVSDVILVQESETVKPGFYFVETFGFKEVTFLSKKRYGAVLWEVPAGDGLTSEMFSDAMRLMLSEKTLIPMEVDNENLTSSAMGLMSAKEIENESWIRREALRVISDMENEDSSCEYEVSGGTHPVTIRIMR